MIRGTPLQALKKLGEWETLEMVQRYAHLSARPFGALGETSLTTPPEPMQAAI